MYIERAGEYGFFFFKQKTAYEIYQCDWSSDVCSSDLCPQVVSGVGLYAQGRFAAPLPGREKTPAQYELTRMVHDFQRGNPGTARRD